MRREGYVQRRRGMSMHRVMKKRHHHTYARTYNRFFCRSGRSQGHSTIHRWITRTLHDTRQRISSRIRFANHILTIHRTQRVGNHIEQSLYNTVVHHHRSLTLGWIILYLRPLQRRILQHLWRPNGPMYRKTCSRMLASCFNTTLDEETP